MWERERQREKKQRQRQRESETEIQFWLVQYEITSIPTMDHKEEKC